MPTGVAFENGSLYVVAIDKLLRYDDAENNLDNMPKPVVVYDDMPPYTSHGWKYLADDHKGAFFIRFGPPFNIGIPPTSVSQIRRVNYTNGLAELVAEGVRNSVGGDVDPRSGDYWFTENARDWMSRRHRRATSSTTSRNIGEHFGYPYCHQGDIPDPKFAMGHKCDEFTPPVGQARSPCRAARHEVLHRHACFRRNIRTTSSSPSTARGTATTIRAAASSA